MQELIKRQWSMSYISVDESHMMIDRVEEK